MADEANGPSKTEEKKSKKEKTKKSKGTAEEKAGKKARHNPSILTAGGGWTEVDLNHDLCLRRIKKKEKTRTGAGQEKGRLPARQEQVTKGSDFPRSWGRGSEGFEAVLSFQCWSAEAKLSMHRIGRLLSSTHSWLCTVAIHGAFCP